jgi:hypothetical protein
VVERALGQNNHNHEEAKPLYRLIPTLALGQELECAYLLNTVRTDSLSLWLDKLSVFPDTTPETLSAKLEAAAAAVATNIDTESRR